MKFRLFLLIHVLVLAFVNSTFCIDKKEVSFKTEDGFTIKATLQTPETGSNLPAVILIHQGGSDRSEWKSLVKKLGEQQFITLAYDVRGHGSSDKVESISSLFNDPNQAPLDMKAAITFLRNHEKVDPFRIAIVGASIGGNLACVGSGDLAYGIKTAVSMSAKTSAVKNLAGEGKQLSIKSVFYISSEKEQKGTRAKWSRELYDQTSEPKKITIVEGSRAHGVGIFKDDPKLEDDIINWLKKTL
ncbi:alpha/beta fold hydrolase [Fulvivirgaceae bacterium BMA10]|uniref:Alpha/beta fold hydrolase n=1 Tax=Splendidivirga corallicola TaxID=3051826 RepID=A0ABT8KMZ8_9BACT|nr:alpha/beta fold hydrolase [Fulvivirgaceae bacterium BMA10]